MAYISILVKSESIVSKGLEIATTPIWNVGKKLKEVGQVLIQIKYTCQATSKGIVKLQRTI